MEGNFFVPIAMFGWVPVVLVLFALLPGRRAAITAFLLAWLFLPMADYKVPGITAYTKMNATCGGVLLGALLFDLRTVVGFRPRWVDIPMVIWCLCPAVSALLNGYTAYDACSALVYQTLSWGLPYLIGRLYFGDARGLRELAVGIFIGGLVYVPLCLYEIRFSPQLHRMVYGYFQHDWMATKRAGGWRPMVFMQHGLAVGLWMVTASVLGVWLWLRRGLRTLWGLPVAPLVAVLATTAVLCKSAGALTIGLIGLAALTAANWVRFSIVVLVLAAVPIGYMGLRGVGGWNADELVSAAGLLGEDRADSLKVRLQSENGLLREAQSNLLFGRSRFLYFGIANDPDNPERGSIIPDGLWIIVLGKWGLAGLAALTTVVVFPALLCAYRWRRLPKITPALAPASALAIIVLLYTIDNLFNAMVNPIYMLAAGGVCGAMALRARAPVAPRAAPTRWRRGAAPPMHAPTQPHRPGTA